MLTRTLPTEHFALGDMLKSQAQSVPLVLVGSAQFQLAAFLQFQTAYILTQLIYNG